MLRENRRRRGQMPEIGAGKIGCHSHLVQISSPKQGTEKFWQVGNPWIRKRLRAVST